MRKSQKKQIEEFIRLLEQAHDEIRKNVEHKDSVAAQALLVQCQEGAVQIGELIEKTEGENAPTIVKLEEYCEVVYKIHEELSQNTGINAGKIHKRLKKVLIQAENSIKNDIPIRLEMVFMPYKSSMWDALESVWKAADANPDCDAYVVPIPYYDRNPDGSLGAFHYEGDRMPSYVPVMHYDAYRIEEREPDAVFIHNPYDQMNRVTSVEPRFYSYNLKEHTECLVYIPYFVTSGGMGEGMASCIAYYFADYIVIQAEKFRKFYDSTLPHEKLLPLGSPKFDKVAELCKNPPEPPAEWKEKMAGKKIYFYNTSINGMLANTENFLRKMEYVFRCFAKCDSACLLWRPHPLLESTFDSMRTEYKPVYERLKQYFIESGLGIYDDTPEIEPTIALCDAYIGDGATSVTALFGAAGKPIFLLENHIYCEANAEDWRGEIIQPFCPYPYGNDRYIVTQGNKLYYDQKGDYRYRYCCDLCNYAYGDYYITWVISISGKDYVCPYNAQEILILEHQIITKRVKLERHLEQVNAFLGCMACGKYLLLIPNKYPAIVRYDTVTGEVRYFTEYLDVFIDESKGERRFGCYCVWKEYLFLASSVNNNVLALHVPSGRVQIMTTGAENNCGSNVMVVDGEELWLLPYEGYTVTRWNPETGSVREYDCHMEGLICRHPGYGYTCNMLPFSLPAVFAKELYLPPGWGNQYLRLNKETGEVAVWMPPFAGKQKNMGCYYPSAGDSAMFLGTTEELSNGQCRLFTYSDKKIYEFSSYMKQWQEREIEFLPDEMKEHEAGFCRGSEWEMYAAKENVFNSLSDFLEGRLQGQPFDETKAIQEFEQIAVNSDGTCGEKVYRFVHDKLTGQ